MTLEGAIAPRCAAAWRRDAAGRLGLLDFAAGRATAAEGVFAEELAQFLRGGAPGPVLSRVGAAHPALALARAVREAARLPLTRAAALRLEGFDTLFVELTAHCNQRCVHCYAGASPEGEARLDRGLLDGALDDARALGFRRVQLTGGEPLSRPDLPEIVAATRARGFELCEVYTNGTLLDAGLLARLAPERPAFAVSLYSHEPATHDAITGLPGSHAATLAAIGRVVAAGLAVRGAMVVMERNAAHVQATMELLRSLGVERRSASATHEVGRGRLFEGGFTPPEAPCTADEPRAHGTLRIAADGAVYPCIFNRTDLLGSLRERSLRRIVEEPPPSPAAESPDLDFVAQAPARLQCATCRATSWVLQLAGVS